ncbi:MAG: hypothetical protein ACE5ES_05485 [Candidatus Nanoarchaeia archaeon]
MEKFLENLYEAEKTLKTASHIIYVTFPLVKDKHLLLKTLTELKKTISKCINAILQYEYLYKRIVLHQSPKANLKTFKEQCARRYNITLEELKQISELFDLVEKHKESPFEFVKKDKIVILSENLQPQTLTLEKIKVFLHVSKNILEKTKQGLKEDI